MTKVVINKKFGGFCLSHEGIMRYLELKGITPYVIEGKFDMVTYSYVPEEDRIKDIDGDTWAAMSMEERKQYNETYHKQTFHDRTVERDDPILIQVVEELGRKANGDHAALKIVEIPDDVLWEVLEYDGNEWVAEVHRTWG